MSLQGHRTSLTVLWASCFMLAIVGILYLRWIVRIGPTASSDFFDLIITQYAPYLGAVLGFQFAVRSSNLRNKEDPSVPYWLAMAVSSLWNLVTVGFVVQACLSSDMTQSAMKDIKAVVPKLAWIVAPAIGLFFGRPGEALNDHQD